jgi:hypothetical protein
MLSHQALAMSHLQSLYSGHINCSILAAHSAACMVDSCGVSAITSHMRVTKLLVGTTKWVGSCIHCHSTESMMRVAWLTAVSAGSFPAHDAAQPAYAVHIAQPRSG